MSYQARALMRARPEGCASDLALDRLVAGELAEPEAKTLRAHVAACTACGERLATIEADAATYLASAPPAPSRVVVPFRRPARSRVYIGVVAGGLAAAAALLLWFRGRAENEPGDASATLDERGVRTKGGERLGFFVRRGERVLPGGPGERLRPGDALRFTVTTATPKYVAVLSVDGAQQASVYFPAGAPPLHATRVDAGQDAPLPLSTVLDATLGAETFYGLFCDEPVALAPVIAALAAAPRTHPTVPGCAIDSIAVVKDLGDAAP